MKIYISSNLPKITKLKSLGVRIPIHCHLTPELKLLIVTICSLAGVHCCHTFSCRTRGYPPKLLTRSSVSEHWAWINQMSTSILIPEHGSLLAIVIHSHLPMLTPSLIATMFKCLNCKRWAGGKPSWSPPSSMEWGRRCQSQLPKTKHCF